MGKEKFFMKVSLIMPTINVIDELVLFLESLARQTFKDFELVVVDQNEHDEVFKILKRYEKLFDIKYTKSEEKGLSLNRNKGLILRKGEIVGFPDDDCEYADDTLEKVVSFFERKKIIKFIHAVHLSVEKIMEQVLWKQKI